MPSLVPMNNAIADRVCREMFGAEVGDRVTIQRTLQGRPDNVVAEYSRDVLFAGATIRTRAGTCRASTSTSSTG